MKSRPMMRKLPEAHTPLSSIILFSYNTNKTRILPLNGSESAELTLNQLGGRV